MKAKWPLFLCLGLLFRCVGPDAQKQPLPKKQHPHDCARLAQIILEISNDLSKLDQPIWADHYSDTTSKSFLEWSKANGYGKGVVCIGFINAGGEQLPGEYIHYKNNVEYRFIVYQTQEQAKLAVASAIGSSKVILSKNRVFRYEINRQNEKNISKVILKAAADFLKDTE